MPYQLHQRRARAALAFGALALAGLALAAAPAGAQSGSPGPRSQDEPSLMQRLADQGMHDIDEESWNAYSQITLIDSYKPAFSAAYTNLNGSTNSLLPNEEQSYTGTVTLYLGARLWSGAEGYVVPEVISEVPFSQLRGLGGAIQNFELQKGGTASPQIYHSRLFVKQTFEFGGESTAAESGPMQLGTHYDSRRIDFAVGNFSILDFFDSNAFDIDPRQGFLSLGFLTYAAWDFAADARGYSYGGISEFYWDDWTVRLGRITPPKEPNQEAIDFRLLKYYGDQIELEHQHKIRGKEGLFRILAYRNHEDIGSFSDAIGAFEADPHKNATSCPGFNYGSGNADAPDLCWARKPNTKLGVGTFFQQYVAQDIGVFARAMYSDGKTEVDSYTTADRSAAAGVLSKGALWGRPKDVTGVGLALDWISGIHARYLALGGIDGFVGDGAINAATERSLDLFYSIYCYRSLWLTGDYQHIENPGYNADRGPLNVYTVRIHGEF